MLRAEQMNLKPSINLSLHAGAPGDVLGAGSTRDTRVVFFLVGGISDKSLFEINSYIKVSNSWMLMRMDPLLTLLCKHGFLFKRQGEDDNKGGWTLFKKHHSDKSHKMKSIGFGFFIFVLAHDLNNWTRLCWGESMWPEYKNWCCHHNGWGIVLQADADQMSKCCDLLRSEMSSSMNSSGFCLISSDKIICKIYHGEPSSLEH